MTRSILLFSFLIVVLGACGNETEIVDESTFGYDYFPLEVGKYIEYQSDSTNYSNDGNIVISTSGFVREEVVDVNTNALNEDIYTINRFFRRDIADEWKLTDVWSSSKDSERAYKTEENLKFVKLVFPVRENKRWDGNIFFNENIEILINNEVFDMYVGWNHKMEEINVPYTLESENFEETTIVRLVDIEDTIRKLQVYERYAKGIGLIEKTMVILGTQNLNEALPFEDSAEQGFTHHLRMIDHN